VLARVGAVEDDRVAIDAADRQIVLRRREDVRACVGAAVWQDRVARRRPRDRALQGRLVLGDADLGASLEGDRAARSEAGKKHGEGGRTQGQGSEAAPHAGKYTRGPPGVPWAPRSSSSRSPSATAPRGS